MHISSRLLNKQTVLFMFEVSGIHTFPSYTWKIVASTALCVSETCASQRGKRHSIVHKTDSFIFSHLRRKNVNGSHRQI